MQTGCSENLRGAGHQQMVEQFGSQMGMLSATIFKSRGI
jgi:hypothetical protein